MTEKKFLVLQKYRYKIPHNAEFRGVLVIIANTGKGRLAISSQLLGLNNNGQTPIVTRI